MAKKKKKKKKEMPKVSPELEGFNIKVDSFGEIKSSFNIDKINDFLNKSVDDKKLRDREDLEFIKNKKKKTDEEENRDEED